MAWDWSAVHVQADSADPAAAVRRRGSCPPPLSLSGPRAFRVPNLKGSNSLVSEFHATCHASTCLRPHNHQHHQRSSRSGCSSSVTCGPSARAPGNVCTRARALRSCRMVCVCVRVARRVRACTHSHARACARMHARCLPGCVHTSFARVGLRVRVLRKLRVRPAASVQAGSYRVEDPKSHVLGDHKTAGVTEARRAGCRSLPRCRRVCCSPEQGA